MSTVVFISPCSKASLIIGMLRSSSSTLACASTSDIEERSPSASPSMSLRIAFFKVTCSSITVLSLRVVLTSFTS